MALPAYAIDEQTAVRVDGAEVDVVSEGRWTSFTPWADRRPPTRWRWVLDGAACSPGTEEEGLTRP